MSIEFGTTMIHGWQLRHATLEWGVRWPDGNVHPCESRRAAYATVEKHRAKGLRHTRVVCSPVQTIVGSWQAPEGLVLLAEPERRGEGATVLPAELYDHLAADGPPAPDLRTRDAARRLEDVVERKDTP